jgi:hypothetical protein
MKKRKTAGEVSKQLYADTTKYNAREVGQELAESVYKEVRASIETYSSMINENEFCAVMLIAEDPLIKNLKRRKFYCWPYLPKPRPNQSVWLYNKTTDKIKRLWILPSAMVMAELTTLATVHKQYQTMQAWSMAFYCGTFWEYIRHEHNIDMLSEAEYVLAHREELIKAGGQFPSSNISDSFDFSKIQLKHVVDTDTAISE